MNPGGHPLAFPTLEVGILFFDGVEAQALERRALGVLNRIFHSPFSIWIAYARRVSIGGCIEPPTCGQMRALGVLILVLGRGLFLTCLSPFARPIFLHSPATTVTSNSL